MRGDHARHPLRQVALGVTRKDLVQVGLAVLLGRLAVEHRNRKRIGHRNGGDASGQRLDVELLEQPAHRHQPHRLVAVHCCENAERRACLRARDGVEAETQLRSRGQSRDVEADIFASRLSLLREQLHQSVPRAPFRSGRDGEAVAHAVRPIDRRSRENGARSSSSRTSPAGRGSPGLCGCAAPSPRGDRRRAPRFPFLRDRPRCLPYCAGSRPAKRSRCPAAGCVSSPAPACSGRRWRRWSRSATAGAGYRRPRRPAGWRGSRQRCRPRAPARARRRGR